MALDKNVVGWFEIPVSDMDRAIKFYQEVLGLSLTRSKMGDLDMAWFPWVEGGIGSAGSLVFHPENYHPHSSGTLVYFTAQSGDVGKEIKRVEAAGGQVLRGKTLISEDVGYMALFLDTEGNRVALHSRA